MFCYVLKQNLWQVAEINIKSVAEEIDCMPTGRARAWSIPDDLSLETGTQAAGELRQLVPNGLRTATREATLCHSK